MKRPRLLDLFCGAGGAAMGYYRAGFDVVGVDIKPQPRYPFEFYQGDAMTWPLDGFDVVHASPPCQAYSILQKQNKRAYPDLIQQVRTHITCADVEYIIENVKGAPLRNPVMLCGTMFPNLRVIRHRMFEASFPLDVLEHKRHPLVFTYDKRKFHYGKLDQDTSFVQVTGGGNCTIHNARRALGIHWMNKKELNESIPPVYTEYIGKQLIQHLRHAIASTQSTK